MPSLSKIKGIYPFRDYWARQENKGVSNGVYRVIDANINRTKEGLRVCEEVARFIIADRNLTSQFKKIRHEVRYLVNNLRNIPRLIAEREALKDVGRTLRNKSELKRLDFQDIFFANIQRVKESIRVLEEFSKLDNVIDLCLTKGTKRSGFREGKSCFRPSMSKAKVNNIALKFKKIRYDIYALEKKVIKKFPSLCHHR